MHKHLSNFAEIREVDVETNNTTHAVDMQNFDGVLFLLKTTGTEDVKAQQDDSLDGSDEHCDDPTDLEDSKVETSANDVTFIDIYRPTERYIQLHVEDDGAVDGPVLAMKYHGISKPVDNDVSDEIEGNQLISPDEGTA